MSATQPVAKPATTTVAAIRATVHRTTDVSVRPMAARTHVCVGREWREQAGLIKSRRVAQVVMRPRLFCFTKRAKPKPKDSNFRFSVATDFGEHAYDEPARESRNEYGNKCIQSF
jgi:hypothetical protein